MSTAKRRDEGGKRRYSGPIRSSREEVRSSISLALMSNGTVDRVARTQAHTDFLLEDEMRKRAKGESAVFANFHVGGGCVSLAYRDYRNNRIIISVYYSVMVMVDDVGIDDNGSGGVGRV